MQGADRSKYINRGAVSTLRSRNRLSCRVIIVIVIVRKIRDLEELLGEETVVLFRPRTITFVVHRSSASNHRSKSYNAKFFPRDKSSKRSDLLITFIDQLITVSHGC